MAIEQLGAQATFKRLDPTTDGCLLGIQLARGGAEASGFRDGQKKTHVIPIAEDVRDFVLTGRRIDHRNNRYNVFEADTFTCRCPSWFILPH
jgi:hypothetical protein